MTKTRRRHATTPPPKQHDDSSSSIRPADDVFVAWCCNPRFGVDPEFNTSLLKLQKAWGGMNFGSLETGPVLAQARNQIVHHFLHDTPCKILLMLDSDMKFTVDAVTRVLELVSPTQAGAGLCERQDDKMPGGKAIVAYRFGDRHAINCGLDDDCSCDRARVLHPVINHPNEPFLVDATGAACIALHRQYVDTVGMYAKDPAYPYFVDGRLGDVPVGEDMGFWVRASEAGLSLAIHPEAKFEHRKARWL